MFGVVEVNIELVSLLFGLAEVVKGVVDDVDSFADNCTDRTIARANASILFVGRSKGNKSVQLPELPAPVPPAPAPPELPAPPLPPDEPVLVIAALTSS